jgi:hypothetical protein
MSESDKTYPRPTTRGELAEKLNTGIDCEVASYVAEMTYNMLAGWLNCKHMSTRPSENAGWTIFEANSPTPGYNPPKIEDWYVGATHAGAFLFHAPEHRGFIRGVKNGQNVQVPFIEGLSQLGEVHKKYEHHWPNWREDIAKLQAAAI